MIVLREPHPAGGKSFRNMAKINTEKGAITKLGIEIPARVMAWVILSKGRFQKKALREPLTIPKTRDRTKAHPPSIIDTGNV